MNRQGVWLCLIAAVGVSTAQDRPLEPGHSETLHLGGGSKGSVRIAAASGDYLLLEVQADENMAVRTSLFDPDGNLAAVTPSLGGTGGRARIAAYAEKAGTFRLDVTSPMFRPEPHACTITLTAHRPATAQDRTDAEGHREFAKAAALANSGAAGMRQAIGALERPIQLAREADDLVLEMRATFGQGQFLGTLGEQDGALEEFQQALPAFEHSLELCRRFGDARAEAHVMSSLGQSYGNLEKNGEAAEWYRKALGLQRATHQAWETALTLNNLASAEAALGRLDLALGYLREQEILRKELKDDLGLNQMRVSLADTYLALGDFEHALEAAAATLPAWSALDDPQSQTDAYAKLGLAYMAAGEYDAAATALEHAVALGRKLNNSKTIANNLVLLAQLAALRHDASGASSAYQRALAAAREGGYRRDESLALSGLGELAIASGNPQGALPLLREALAVANDTGQAYDQANLRRQLGEAAAALGKPPEALQEFEAALAIERRLGDRFGEVQTLAALASVQEKQGRNQAALVSLDQAMAVIDNTRSSLAEPGLRASYLASQRAIYERSAGLLARTAPKDARAFDVSELAHARALLDLRGKTANEAGGGSDPALRSEARALDSALHAAALKSAGARDERRIAELLAVRNQIELRLRQSDAESAPHSVAPLSLAQIRERLLAGKEEVLLEYFTGQRESHLWLITKSDFAHYQLPGEAELGAAARRLYNLLTQRNRSPRGLPAPEADRKAAVEAAALARTLLPMSGTAISGRRLILVLDGPLQMVPFAMLPVPGSQRQTLGEVSRLTVAPSASVLARLRGAPERSASGRVMVVADPIYSTADPRAGSGRTASLSARDPDSPLLRSAGDFRLDGFERLRMSGVEAEQIRKLAPPGAVTALTGFDATPSAFRRSGLDRYSIIHVAAHTLLDNRHPELSGLVLSLVDRQGRPQDGFLRLFDIYEMHLRADLVVLSACETSMGREMRGEGMLGLARGFLAAGSRRVLASLWKVDDRATAEFMRRFYTALLRGHTTPTAALAAAQRSMREEPAWSAPYYWAPFLLQGDF